MPHRLTKIYTRTGDEGYTQIRDSRLSKDDLLVEAVGTIDELNACIGVVLAVGPLDHGIDYALLHVQHELFDMGGELHLPQHPAITTEMIRYLEQKLDEWNQTLPPLKEFILPGGNQQAAACHVARTVCRRAERCLVKLHRQVPLQNPNMLRYLNRLSDLLFVAARLLARAEGGEEVLWRHERKKN